VLREDTKSFLLRKLELFNFKPLSKRRPFPFDRCAIAKTDAGIRKVILEFLAFFAKHSLRF